MLKRKRGSTWYREVQQETNSILATILGSGSNLQGNDSEDSDECDADKQKFFKNDFCSVDSGSGERSNSNSSDDHSVNSDIDSEHDFSENNFCKTQAITNNFDKEYTNRNINIDSTVERLKKWAVKNKITLTALNELLVIVADAKADDFKGLPKDSRTFLATPKMTLTRKVDPGEYYHFGIQKSLEMIFDRDSREPTNPVEIGINIDGLPLAKSSSSQFYPILGLESKKVFLIGLYHGYEKPKNFNDYLFDLINEAKMLTNNGLELFGRKYSFKITKFLFDAVAKASVLSIKGHAGYSSCTKCFQRGESVQDRVCFPLLNFEKRTHESFVNQSDPAHHTGYSILLEIPNINIISDVPLDYMHLILLGVVKKLLCGLWCNGPPPHKFSNAQFTRISELLLNMRTFVPSDFSRMPRSLKEVKRWKATEFRQFLLYTGPVVLKNILAKKKYQNFLILSVSVRILSSAEYCTMYVDYAENLLICFVNSIKQIYGSHLLTHNFHNLLHLVDDVKKFGLLDDFSNFESENFLQYLGTLIRKHDKPLQQVVRRYQEFINCRGKVNSSKKFSGFNLSQPHSNGPLIVGCSAPEFKSIEFTTFKLSCTPRDSCCALKDGALIEIKNLAFSPQLNDYVIVGQEYMEKLDFFNLPLKSSLLNIFYVDHLGEMKSWPVTDISHKLVRIPYNDAYTVFPLIHTKQD